MVLANQVDGNASISNDVDVPSSTASTDSIRVAFVSPYSSEPSTTTVELKIHRETRFADLKTILLNEHSIDAREAKLIYRGRLIDESLPAHQVLDLSAGTNSSVVHSVMIAARLPSIQSKTKSNRESSVPPLPASSASPSSSSSSSSTTTTSQTCSSIPSHTLDPYSQLWQAQLRMMQHFSSEIHSHSSSQMYINHQYLPQHATHQYQQQHQQQQQPLVQAVNLPPPPIFSGFSSASNHGVHYVPPPPRDLPHRQAQPAAIVPPTAPAPDRNNVEPAAPAGFWARMMSYVNTRLAFKLALFVFMLSKDSEPAYFFTMVSMSIAFYLYQVGVFGGGNAANAPINNAEPDAALAPPLPRNANADNAPDVGAVNAREIVGDESEHTTAPAPTGFVQAVEKLVLGLFASLHPGWRPPQPRRRSA